MTLVVEDGRGNPNAESYVSVADVSAYVAKYGGTFDTSDVVAAEAACRRATRYVDATYRNLFQGAVANANQQALEWPRSGVYYSNNTLPSDKLPSFLKDAVCEAAIQEKTKPGCLLPVTSAGANITSITADSVSIEYGGAGLAQGVKVFPGIALALSPLLQQQSSPFNGTAGRG